MQLVLRYYWHFFLLKRKFGRQIKSQIDIYCFTASLKSENDSSEKAVGEKDIKYFKETSAINVTLNLYKGHLKA